MIQLNQNINILSKQIRAIESFCLKVYTNLSRYSHIFIKFKKIFANFRKLREEIELLESKSVDIPTEHIQSATICVRCKQKFGYFIDKGEMCPKCNYKVCSKCQVNRNQDWFMFSNSKNQKWLCILCYKHKYLIWVWYFFVII